MTVSTAEADEYDVLIQSLLAASRNVLVRGGAGSGKTTAALRKAAIAADHGLTFPHSKVLFLSFANATIDRVAEHALATITAEQRRSLELSTYHAFAWSILRSHGYLLGAPRAVRILGTGEENAFRSSFASDADVDAEFRRLFIDFGNIAFDHFATFANEILRGHPALLRAYADAYPLIFLDEFQDTSESQWALMKTLGSGSQLVALGDPDQRIYAFTGASPTRFEDFIAEFDPLQFDLSAWNWRSPEGAIVEFGRDILSGTLQSSYPGVHLILTEHPPLYRLKLEVLAGIKRLRQSKTARTIAILTSSNALSAAVYDYFLAAAPLPALNLDIHAGKGEAFAAAIFVATLLESTDDLPLSIAALSRALARYVRTRSPKLSQSAREEAAKLDREATRLESGAGGRELKSTTQLRKIMSASLVRSRTGHPFADYLTTVSAVADGDLKLLKEVARNTRLVNLVTPGGELESQLAGQWRSTGTYSGAAEHMRNAAVSYQVQSSKAGSRNLIVMNIHRAKGKEFEEVFVYEERWRPFVRDDETDLSNGRYAMNVAVTRARQRVTILTPKARPSRLFTERRDSSM